MEQEMHFVIVNAYALEPLNNCNLVIMMELVKKDFRCVAC